MWYLNLSPGALEAGGNCFTTPFDTAKPKHFNEMKDDRPNKESKELSGDRIFWKEDVVDTCSPLAKLTTSCENFPLTALDFPSPNG